MAFYCSDCSYRGKKSGQGGSCPACGSYNVSAGYPEAPAKKPPGKWRLALLAGLWVYLIGMIIWKLFS